MTELTSQELQDIFRESRKSGVSLKTFLFLSHIFMYVLGSVMQYVFPIIGD